MKNILEPIFEADFYPSSFGFRPGRHAHKALEKLRLLLHQALGSPQAPGSGHETPVRALWLAQAAAKRLALV